MHKGKFFAGYRGRVYTRRWNRKITLKARPRTHCANEERMARGREHVQFVRAGTAVPGPPNLGLTLVFCGTLSKAIPEKKVRTVALPVAESVL